VHRRIASLDATVAAASEQPALAVEQRRPDRDPAFVEAGARFVQGNLQQGVVVERRHAAIIARRKRHLQNAPAQGTATR
jgi:hypothetical protein